MTAAFRTRPVARRATSLAAFALALAVAAGCGAPGGSGRPGGAPSGTVAVSVPGANAVLAVDVSRRAVSARAAVPAPQFLAVDPVRPRIYVGSAGATLVTLDRATLAVIHEDPVAGIRDIVVPPAGERLYLLAVGPVSSRIEVRDPATSTHLAETPVPGLSTSVRTGPGNLIALAPDGATLYVAAPGILLAFDTWTLALTRIPLAQNFVPDDVAIVSAGRRVLVAGTDGASYRSQIVAIDAAFRTVAWTSEGASGECLAVSPGPGPDSALVTLSFLGLSGVTALDLASRSLLDPTPDDIENLPAEIALSARGNVLAAASNAVLGGAGRLVLFDSATLATLGTVSLPGAPGHLAWLP